LSKKAVASLFNLVIDFAFKTVDGFFLLLQLNFGFLQSIIGFGKF
jgi:hypothetical protein